jgi:copper chaperone
MKRLWLLNSLLIAASSSVWAAEIQYELRVDGLACPYCAYGIEKKLKAVDGLIHDSLQVKLNEGLVLFQMKDASTITEPSLKRLIHDSGFTLRGVKTRQREPEL